MNANSTATEQFQQLLRGYSLQQHIAGPTFRASGSTIDVIVTNQQSVSKAGVVHCDYSPHNWSRVLMSVPDLRLQKCTITTRCWSSAAEADFCSEQSIGQSEQRIGRLSDPDGRRTQRE
ncbi:hypothetical protein FJT64_004339 [Amphibalanus amphitrite]|uniref:Uncharacterized protein n=1 Tax=Amphibalanus amphitrite TaxID=1232801 RepID=A0A6A4VU37_AMPAM|nr:hypothetical protein FJT64_004339 [Amphibalanus amphitrite]